MCAEKNDFLQERLKNREACGLWHPGPGRWASLERPGGDSSDTELSAHCFLYLLEAVFTNGHSQC